METRRQDRDILSHQFQERDTREKERDTKEKERERYRGERERQTVEKERGGRKTKITNTKKFMEFYPVMLHSTEQSEAQQWIVA